MEHSSVADVKMRSFNKDGSLGKLAGNNIRCVGKYLYDLGYLRSEHITVETDSGVKHLKLFLRDGQVGSVCVDMGRATLDAAALPAAVEVSQLRDFPLEVDGKTYPVWGVGVGNPHCVVFRDAIDDLNLSVIGPRFEHHALFPEGVNTEFVRVVSPTSLRVRVWERGNGETMACGTGACAAVAAAVEKGLCQAGTDISVSLPGGVLTVNYTPERVLLTGGAEIVYQGSFLY